ncbi:MAG: hypothetical protein AAF724_07545 [Pseudomonadota bacterium]
MARRIGRMMKWLLIAIFLVAVVLAIPVVYVEAACVQPPQEDSYEPIVANPVSERSEADTYLSYPQWHIVHAHEGIANVLKDGDAHDFDYADSVVGFWKSFCDLNSVASQNGAEDIRQRLPIHARGAGFTLEMMLRAGYEETLGRLFAIGRGDEKAPQDRKAAEIAADYARSLQSPGHSYDFDDAVDVLWDEPLTHPLRGWERRIVLGGALKAKAAYMGLINGTDGASARVGSPTRSVITGVSADRLSQIEDVAVVEKHAHYSVIETRQLKTFNEAFLAVAGEGGRVLEIAGNDDIMVSVIGPMPDPATSIAGHEIITLVNRDGFDGKRALLKVKITELASLAAQLKSSAMQLERIYAH